MAISQLERAIDEHIAKQQQEDGLTITVDLTKPVLNETQRRAKNIERQLQQRIKTTNDSMALGKLIWKMGRPMFSKKEKCAIARTHLAMGKNLLASAQQSGASTKKAERIIKQAEEDIKKWCISDETTDIGQ